jgi:di/tricarboxylate transporter
VIALSTFIKNVGALAIMMPVAFQLANGRTPRRRSSSCRSRSGR